jgi:hypothetical protein
MTRGTSRCPQILWARQLVIAIRVQLGSDPKSQMPLSGSGLRVEHLSTVRLGMEPPIIAEIAQLLIFDIRRMTHLQHPLRASGYTSASPSCATHTSHVGPPRCVARGRSAANSAIAEAVTQPSDWHAFYTQTARLLLGGLRRTRKTRCSRLRPKFESADCCVTRSIIFKATCNAPMRDDVKLFNAWKKSHI